MRQNVCLHGVTNDMILLYTCFGQQTFHDCVKSLPVLFVIQIHIRSDIVAGLVVGVHCAVHAGRGQR